MLPTAGLYLPETLHRRYDTSPPIAEKEGTRPKYFQRKTGRPKQSPSKVEHGVSTRTISEDSTNVFSSLATTFNFADFVSSSNKASPETVAFVNLIQGVRQTMAEATRLYLSPAVSNFLDAFPEKRTWVENTLQTVQRILNEIGIDMDVANDNGEDNGTISSKRRFELVLKNYKKVLKKQRPLETCRHDLSGAIHIMQTVELYGLPGGMPSDPIFEAPVRPWLPLDDKGPMRGPHTRQKYRLSQTNMSATSVALPEKEWDYVDTGSMYSLPAELPGSTPEISTDLGNANLNNSPKLRISRNRYRVRSATLSRSQAQTERIRSFSPFDTRPWASIDGAQPSSTLEGKTIERNDSGTSTTATFTIPRIARRYRANAIDVQGHRERHSSLPSELPHLESQSSLIDDLELWFSPSTMSDRLPSMQWNSSSVSESTISVPGDTQVQIRDVEEVAVPSVPSVLQPGIRPKTIDSLSRSPEGEGARDLPIRSRPRSVLEHDEPGSPIGPTQSTDNEGAIPQDHCITDKVYPTEQKESESTISTNHDKPARTTSTQSSRSFVARKPLPEAANPPMRFRAPINTPFPEISEAKHADITENSVPTSPSSPRAVHTTSDESELSLLQQKLLHQTYVTQDDEQPNTLSKEPEEPPSSPMSLRSLPSMRSTMLRVQPEQVDEMPSGGVSIPPSVAKPMSAQAKRRAAHARRMQIAFGEK